MFERIQNRHKNFAIRLILDTFDKLSARTPSNSEDKPECRIACLCHQLNFVIRITYIMSNQ